MQDKKWNISPESIEDKTACEKYNKMWNRAYTQMRQRTHLHDQYGLVANNKSLFKGDKTAVSEGTTQALERKMMAQSVQRIPDGKLESQFDKNSIEQVQSDYIWESKILTNEFDGNDFLKILHRSWKSSFRYCFACIRTGFEKDYDNDVRVSYSHIPYYDVYPAPDTDYIEQADWYMIRETISKSDLEDLIDEEGNVHDSTYNADVIKFLVENDYKSSKSDDTKQAADKGKGVTKLESIEIRTLYRRHDDEFVTYVPSINAILRTVKNYDPRKDVPLHFLILDPDPDFPLGRSLVSLIMRYQQIADTFSTAIYRLLRVAMEPPFMTRAIDSPKNIKMSPGAWWDLGTNQNSVIEPYRVETQALTQHAGVMEGIQANMMKNLNITDATVASDANVMAYSGTPQGVMEQHNDKTITINQIIKRVEIFCSEIWNHAMRSYVSAMHGEVWLTVDEDTRRKIWDIEANYANGLQEGETPPPSIIDGDTVLVDFDKLKKASIQFTVRSGSSIEDKKEEERSAITEMFIPYSQMMNSVSDENKQPFEEGIMQLFQRWTELANVDLSAQLGGHFQESIERKALQATMDMVAEQQGQIDQLMQAQGMLPPEAAQSVVEGQVPPQAPMTPPEPQMPPVQPQIAPQPQALSQQAPIEEPLAEEEIIIPT
jgi:hypothetical protein